MSKTVKFIMSLILILSIIAVSFVTYRIIVSEDPKPKTESYLSKLPDGAVYKSGNTVYSTVHLNYQSDPFDLRDDQLENLAITAIIYAVFIFVYILAAVKISRKSKEKNRLQQLKDDFQ